LTQGVSRGGLRRQALLPGRGPRAQGPDPALRLAWTDEADAKFDRKKVAAMFAAFITRSGPDDAGRSMSRCG
jgi:hypothetical protein